MFLFLFFRSAEAGSSSQTASQREAELLQRWAAVLHSNLCGCDTSLCRYEQCKKEASSSLWETNVRLQVAIMMRACYSSLSPSGNKQAKLAAPGFRGRDAAAPAGTGISLRFPPRGLRKRTPPLRAAGNRFAIRSRWYECEVTWR